jgi:hypothetical protein
MQQSISRLLPALLFSFFANVSAIASFDVPIVFTEIAPKIDGRLEQNVWKNAVLITDLIQRLPNTGEPVSERTEILLLYDNDFIYVAMRCTDDPAKITANELARDVSLGNDDRVQLIFDTFLDKRNGYWFQIGPKGSIGDALVSENGAGFNKQWDGLWQGRSHIHEKGWDAEIAIPFKTLNFRPGQTEWGMKIIRHIKRKAESAYWPVANLNTYRFQVSDAGKITGLNGITKGIGLDIRPFIITGLDDPESENTGMIRNKNPLFNVGGDIFYRPTPGLKTALTFNTDFAQTEVDSRQINLTRFSLLFPEKRGFFLDGAQYFNFGLAGDRTNRYAARNIPFFSRRIGLDPDGNPIPIEWGAKITGQAGPWNIGFQHITDKPQSARNLTVARLTRNVGSQSYVGVIATNGNTLSQNEFSGNNENIGTPGSNQLVGLDVRLATASFRGNKILAFSLFGLKSFSEGLEGNDLSWGTEINYPNDFLRFRAGHQEIGENYRAGIGFTPRLGIRENYVEVALGPRPNKYGILQITFQAEGDFITDFGGELLTRDIQLTPLNLEMISGDEFRISAKSTYEFLDEDFEIYSKESISIPAGEYNFWRYSVQFESARRRRVWLQPAFTWGTFFDGHRQDFELQFGYKINTPIFVGFEYERNNVMLTEGDFTTEIYRANANIFFSPDISLTNFVQYDNLTEEIGWQSRFRWILKPGNELLFVWNSNIYKGLDESRFSIQESFTRLKLNYNFRF